MVGADINITEQIQRKCRNRSDIGSSVIRRQTHTILFSSIYGLQFITFIATVVGPKG